MIDLESFLEAKDVLICLTGFSVFWLSFIAGRLTI